MKSNLTKMYNFYLSSNINICLEKSIIIHSTLLTFNMCKWCDTIIKSSCLSLDAGQDYLWHQASISVCSSRWKLLDFRPVCQSSSNFLLFILLQCPHEIICPKLVLESVMPCTFQQMYHPLALADVRPNSATLSVKPSAAQALTYSFLSSTICHRQRSSATWFWLEKSMMLIQEV